MTTPQERRRSQATAWELPDELWDLVRPILEEHDPPPRIGRGRIDQRRALEAVIYRRDHRCAWDALPTSFPDDSSVHRTHQRWVRLGLLDRLLTQVDAWRGTAGPPHGRG